MATYDRPWCEALFERLHKIPELDRDLPKTCSVIRAALTEIGVPYTESEGGIVAELAGVSDRGICLIRADMDALPVTELTDLPYASEHAGRMHACGHDAHVSCALAALKLLKESDSHHATLRVCFQPAEETDGGAARMIAAGLLEGVSAALCLHIAPALPTGSFGFKSGKCRGASDMFDITVTGRVSHGAYPHLGADAIVAASAIVGALQTLVSRETDPVDGAVITVGSFQAGTARNIVCGKAQLSGIVRTLSAEHRRTVCERIAEIARGVARAYGAEASVTFRSSYPALINDRGLTDALAELARKQFGQEAVIWHDVPQMGVDDFAYIAEKVPSSYVDLGTTPAGCAVYPLHSPHLVVDKRALAFGAELIALWAQSGA